MQDDNVFAMLLCDGFIYSPTTEMHLYEQYKTVVCEGVCKIDGSKIDAETETAFVASNSTSLDFCGVDFENFFFGVSLFDAFFFIMIVGHPLPTLALNWLFLFLV